MEVPHTHLLLDANGTVHKGPFKALSTWVKLASDLDIMADDDVIDTILVASTVVVEFLSYGDGRGFSLARILREQIGFKGELIAAGSILPDQMRSANQCGYSALLVSLERVERFGLHTWRDALTQTVKCSYMAKPATPDTSVWQQRLTSPVIDNTSARASG